MPDAGAGLPLDFAPSYAASVPIAPEFAPADAKRAAVLTKLGDGLSSRIRQIRDAQRLTNTHRRARMASSALRQADHLEERLHATWALADACQFGRVPFVLRGVRTAAVIDNMLDYREWPDSKWSADVRARLLSASIDEAHYLEARVALVRLVDERKQELRGSTDEQEEARRTEIHEKEIALALARIPDFFPTPKALAARMAELADLQGVTGIVLEPSAGRGDICDAIRRDNPNVPLFCCEVSYSLVELLTLKRYYVVAHDFLAHTLDELRAVTEPSDPGYARIIMNPPMTGMVDIDHVLHAYELLRPGGRIVALMSESPFFRDDKKAVAFRVFLAQHGVEGERLGSAFEKADRATSVHIRLIVLDKPKGEVRS